MKFTYTSIATHRFTMANIVGLCMSNMGHFLSVRLSYLRSK
jgi:hypothetical protein